MLSFALVLALGQTAPSDAVKVCQVGYLPGETKVAMLTAPAQGQAEVKRLKDGVVVLRPTIGPERTDPDSGDGIRSIDFSAVRTPGEYVVSVPGVGDSRPFSVGPEVFAQALRHALRSFTGQRCGTAVSLAPDFPEYQNDACHLAPAQYHPSSGRQGTRDVSGGWHDAGDYGRYIVNSGITTGTLLWAYEMYEPKMRRRSFDLPEQVSKFPDMLTEVKWNLDWMLKMQDDDGGVWQKATSAQFCGFVMPADDKSPTLVIGTGKAPYKNTTATADLAAVAAIAARVYRKFDAAYADRCLRAAESAFDWAEAHPSELYVRNPAGIGTGGYGDANPTDERLWAAAELYRTTGAKKYHDVFLRLQADWTPAVVDAPQGWPEVRNLGMFAYAMTSRKDRDAGVLARIVADIGKACDAIVARSEANGYRIPLKSTEYYWGSNGAVANYAMMLQVADRIRPNAKFRQAAQDSLHYLLGRNTFATSFVTHVGTKWFKNPHHRPSGADKNAEPWPGLLSGGPNSNGRTPPARQWQDVQGSFATNENAINWNAPLVFALAGTF